MKFERLGNIADIQIGKTPKRDTSVYWGKGFPWVSISDMKGQIITDTKEEITELAVKECGCKLIHKGTLLLSFKLSIGKVAFAGKDLYTNEAICGIIIKDTTKVYPLYLYYVLKLSRLTGSNVAVKGATLNSASLNSIKLPFPNSLPDQIRIATLLSKAEALITQRKESIQLLDEYIKSVFAEMFGDPVKNEKGWRSDKLSTITKVGTGGTPSRQRESEFYNGEIYWAKTTEVNGSYITDTEEKITELALKESNCKIYPVGTILVAMYGQGKTRGNVGYLKIPSATNQACAAIPPSDYVNQIFLFEQLKLFYEHLRSLARGGNQENLNLTIIGNTKVINPSPELQTQFVQIVEKVEKLKTKYQNSLTELENLFGSLSQSAFKGELDLSYISVLVEEEYQASVNDRDAYPNWEPQYNLDNIEIKAKPQKKKNAKQFGDPFEVDEATAKKNGNWFYNEWLRLHGKTIEEENESVWLESKRSGLRPATIKFNAFEGNAIIHEVFSKQNTGFGFSEFERALKTEKITYTAKEIKEFIFQKLEQKELVQYYATKEWMEAMRHPKFNPPGGPEFSGEGSIWFLVNKTDKAK